MFSNSVLYQEDTKVLIQIIYLQTPTDDCPYPQTFIDNLKANNSTCHNHNPCNKISAKKNANLFPASHFLDSSSQGRVPLETRRICCLCNIVRLLLPSVLLTHTLHSAPLYAVSEYCSYNSAKRASALHCICSTFDSTSFTPSVLLCRTLHLAQ